jgi:hypothetical protein
VKNGDGEQNDKHRVWNHLAAPENLMKDFHRAPFGRANHGADAPDSRVTLQ